VLRILGVVPAAVRIALALLVRDGRVLLVHRSPSRRAYADCWDLAGGHIEPGESPLTAVERECQEELGVRILQARPMPFTVADRALEVHAFLVTRWEGEPSNAAPDEHDDLRWFDADQLLDADLAHPAGLPSILRALADATG
jgi:8-oxo-dGTP diphosphatase